MVSEILGLATGVFVGVVLLLIGILSMFKGSLGQSVKGLLSMIPIGNVKLWGIIFIVAGLALGGFAGTMALGKGVYGSILGGSTASLVNDDVSTDIAAEAKVVDCQFLTISAATAEQNGNITFRTDPNDQAHYYVDLKNSTTAAGSASINGTITCARDTNNIRNGEYTTCYVKAGSYKNADSTTDSNTYYILATSNAKSFVSGFPWQQTAYLNDGAVATTSSNKEKTRYTFAQDTTQRTLGFYATLAGSTNVGYLTNQDSVDVDVICGNNKVAYLTVTKLTE